MHHSVILIELCKSNANLYITPADIKEQFEINCGGNPVSMLEVAHEFSFLTQHNLLIPVDCGVNPNDRFELSPDWFALSDKQKEDWSSTLISSNSIDLKYRRLNTILAALTHFQTYNNDDLDLQEAFFYDSTRLSNIEIDELCLSLNSDPSLLL